MKDERVKVISKLPIINTERLILRKMTLRDIDDIYEYSKDPEVSKYLLWSPHPYKEFTRDYIKRVDKLYHKGLFYDWVLELKESGKVIGTCGFSSIDLLNNVAEIGYVLNREYWGKGLASEAVKCVLEYGFSTLNLHRIEARYIKENDRSLKLLLSCGFNFEGEFRDMMLIKGEYRTVGICAKICDAVNKNMNKNE